MWIYFAKRFNKTALAALIYGAIHEAKAKKGSTSKVESAKWGHTLIKQLLCSHGSIVEVEIKHAIKPTLNTSICV